MDIILIKIEVQTANSYKTAEAMGAVELGSRGPRLYFTHDTLLIHTLHVKQRLAFFSPTDEHAHDARQKVLPPPLNPISMSSPTSPF